MTAKGFNRIADSYIFWILLILAILLRVSMVEYAPFRNDSVRDAMIAQNIVEGRTLIRGSPTGWDGVYRGPVFYHYLTLFYRLSPDPRILTLSSVLPNILALLVCFLFCSRFFGPAVARFATLMYGFSPIAVGMFNFIQEVNLSPLLLVLSLLFLFEIAFNEKKWLVVPLAFCMGLLWDNSQYYLSTIAVAVILLLPKRRILGVAPIPLALAALVLALIPYLWMDAANDFSISTRLAKAMVTAEGDQTGIRGFLNPSTYIQPMTLVFAPLVFALEKTLLIRHPMAFLLSVLQSAMFVVGLVALFAVSYRVIHKRLIKHTAGHRTEIKILYLICWFLAPLPMLMVFSQSPAFRFYYCQYPINFMMIAFGGILLIGGRRSLLSPEEALQQRPGGKAVIWGLIILLCLSQARLTVNVHKSAGLDNLRIRDKRQVGQCIARDGGGGGGMADRIWFNRDDRHDPEGNFYGYEYLLPQMKALDAAESQPGSGRCYAVIADDEPRMEAGTLLCRVNRNLAVFAFQDQASLHSQMQQGNYIPISLKELLINDNRVLSTHFRTSQ